MYKMENDSRIHDIVRALVCTFLILISGGMLYSCSSEDEEPVPPAQEGTGNDEKEKYTYVYQLKADNYNMPTEGTISPEYDDSPEGKDISNLVDGDWVTSFYTPNNSVSIIWKGKEPIVARYYSVMATGDKEGNAPGAWSLYGSNDKEKWMELDNRVRQKFEKTEKKFMALNNNEAYQYYKLTIHQNQGGEGVEILEWMLQTKRTIDTPLLTDFPEGSTPKEIGKRLGRLFAKGKHNGKTLSYPETFTWNGALKYAEVAKDNELIQPLKDGFESFFTTDKNFLPGMDHVDRNMFGSLPLTLYLITKDERYREMGMPYADTQWEVPENASASAKSWAAKGYSWQTRLWIDDMYMIPVIQTHAYKVTGELKYVERAAKEMAMYLDELQRTNGLFYHAPDVPYFWGRGNGWMAAGMAEVLRYLPESSPYHLPIVRGFQTMMASLKNYQTEEGMWRQLIDKPDCWVETSGSAMFTYAFIMGVKYGWLPVKEYGEAARKAWLAMLTYINSSDKVREVCVGTNKKNDMQYYYDRPRNIGDYHGHAPYLWCTVALLEE